MVGNNSCPFLVQRVYSNQKYLMEGLAMAQMCYLALVPLTDATFEEVCQDLKEQALKYLDIFS